VNRGEAKAARRASAGRYRNLIGVWLELQGGGEEGSLEKEMILRKDEKR
jgi:hypothetical protein